VLALVAELRESAVSRITSRLQDERGRRYGGEQFTPLGLRSVLRCLAEVASGERVWSFRTGTPGSWKTRTTVRTTACLVTRVDGLIWVGLRDTLAYKATPGTVWHMLTPWRKRGPQGDAAAKWRNWAQTTGLPEHVTEHWPYYGSVDPFSDLEVDVLLQCETEILEQERLRNKKTT
jgi:hypothetical protein